MDHINRYYSVLGLHPGASQEEIKQAYRQLAKNWHPDRFAHDTVLQRQAEEKIKAINEAYDFLKERSPADLSSPPAEPAAPPASKDFQTVIKTKSSNGEGYYNLGVEHVQAGRHREAIEAFSAAIRVNPQYAEAYRYRGFVYSLMGLELSAEADLTKAKAFRFEQTRSTPPTAAPAAAPAAPLPPRRLSQTLTTSATPTAIALTADGKLLVSGNRDGSLHLWNLRTGQSFYQLTGHAAAISALGFTTNGKLLVSGSQDGTLKLWLLRSAAVLKQFVGHQRGIVALAIAPDQRTLVSVSSDGNLRRWDLNTGGCLQTWGGGSEAIWTIALSPDGNCVAQADEDHRLSLYATRTGEVLRRWPAQPHLILALALHPDNQRLALGRQDGTVQQGSLQGTPLQTWSAHPSPVTALTFAQVGKTLLSGHADGALAEYGLEGRSPRIWSAHSASVTAIASVPPHADAVPPVERLLSSSLDGTLQLWSPPN